MNTALFMLRAVQLGLSCEDLEYLDMGMVFDMITESQNDTYKYDFRATKEDFKRF